MPKAGVSVISEIMDGVRAPRAPDAMTEASGVLICRIRERDIEAVRKVGIGLLIALTSLFAVFETTRGWRIGSKLTGEGDLWNYVGSIAYVLAAEMAVLNGLMVIRRRRGKPLLRWLMGWLPWVFVGVAFTFFACDEMLCIHERLRHAIQQALPILNRAYPGHGARLTLPFYVVGSALFTLAFLRNSLVGRPARTYMVLGFLLVGFAVLLDTMPSRPWHPAYIWGAGEELGEFFAGVMFVAAFMSSALCRLPGVIRARSGSPIG
jgi:hypothetical protein